MAYRTLNPATEELVKNYPELPWIQAEERAKKAQKAWEAWRETPFTERKEKLHKMAKLLRERKERYAAIVTKEMGKPISQSEVEIDKCARGCEYYAEHSEDALQNLVISTEAHKSYVRYDPLGVILGIMPWNFPFWQVLRFSLPALMAGNVVILKHAPNVPECALALEALFREVGFPEFVFQSFFLKNEDVGRLIESGYVAGVSLTGSDRAGSAIAEKAGRHLVKTVLELGGSDPFIVFDDADLDQTIPVAVKSRMLNTGQSCIAAKRFLVSAGIYEEFKKRFVEAVKALKVGDPLNREIDIGPIAREDLLQNLIRQVEALENQGTRFVLEGGCPNQKGYYFRPTIMEVVKPEALKFEEELFGPVAMLYKFNGDDEAVRLANRTAYGLGASLWTKDLKKAEKLGEKIQAGSIFVNGMVKSDPRLPFGGVKKSGYGRELSSIGIHEFVNVKTVWVNE